MSGTLRRGAYLRSCRKCLPHKCPNCWTAPGLFPGSTSPMSPTSTLSCGTARSTGTLRERNDGCHGATCPLNHIATSSVVHFFEELAEVSARLQGGDMFHWLHTRTIND